MLILLLLPKPAMALEFTAPPLPEEGVIQVPEDTETFTEGLWSVITQAVSLLQPAVAEASAVCAGLLAATLLTAFSASLPGVSKQTVDFASALVIAALLLEPANTLIQLGIETVQQLSEYGKLLLPVMTAALAAQGGGATSAAVYTGTAFFDSLLSSAMSSLMVPLLYIFLCLGVACAAVGEEVLGKLRDFIKWLMTWVLRIVLYVFTGYMGITGVVSGSADAAAVKAAKLTISGVVPVVGGILSDASEAVLVSAGVMKSAVGVYGLLAILAVFVGPFLQIGVQYIMLKITCALCAVYAGKPASGLIRDFSGAMGMLLAMTGTMCLLLMISTFCLMKGIG